MNKERLLKRAGDYCYPSDDVYTCYCGGELKFDAAKYAMESEEWLCQDCETTWHVGLTVTRDWELAYVEA